MGFAERLNATQNNDLQPSTERAAFIRSQVTVRFDAPQHAVEMRRSAPRIATPCLGAQIVRGVHLSTPTIEYHREPKAHIRRFRLRVADPRINRDPRVDEPLGGSMKPTARLREHGQSLWLDNITREILDSGQLGRYIEQYSVTGLTSNPSVVAKPIASGAYDDEIHDKATDMGDRETLFFELAIEDLLRAGDLARIEDLEARLGSLRPEVHNRDQDVR
jgi:hypothetical protein